MFDSTGDGLIDSIVVPMESQDLRLQPASVGFSEYDMVEFAPEPQPQPQPPTERPQAAAPSAGGYGAACMIQSRVRGWIVRKRLAHEETQLEELLMQLKAEEALAAAGNGNADADADDTARLSLGVPDGVDAAVWEQISRESFNEHRRAMMRAAAEPAVPSVGRGSASFTPHEVSNTAERSQRTEQQQQEEEEQKGVDDAIAWHRQRALQHGERHATAA
eukprot:COSAG06_NODE_18789_length_868_cov_93.889467_1_plen_218_part_10